MKSLALSKYHYRTFLDNALEIMIGVVGKMNTNTTMRILVNHAASVIVMILGL